MHKYSAFAASLLITLGATSTSLAAQVDPAVQQAIDAAVAANQKADAAGFAWRDAGKMIKQAQAAAAKGDHQTAMKLAGKAREQGILGYQQSLDQQGAGPHH